MPSETEQSASTTTAPITVRLVGEGSASAAADLTARGVTVVDDETASIDCVVVVTDGAEAPVFDHAVGDDGAPVVVYGPDPVAAGNDGVSGFARIGNADALVDQIRWATTQSAKDEDVDNRVATLHRGTVSLIEATSEADLFERTVDIAARLLAFDSCYIAVAEDGLLVKQAGVGDVSDEALPADYGLAGDSYQSNTTHLFRDMQTHPTAEPVRSSQRSGIAVPLGDDAVFVVIADRPGAFDGMDRELAELLVGYVEGTLARIRAAAATETQRELVERLHEGTTALAAVKTREAAAAVAVELAEEILAFDSCYVSVREGEDVVPYAVSSGVGADDAQRAACTQGLVEETLRTGESQLVERRAEDDGPCTYQSAISVPLGSDGVFQAISADPAAFDGTDLELAELLGGHLAGTFSRLAAEESVAAQRERVAQLHAATVDLVEANDVTTLYERTVQTAQSVLGFDTVYVLVVDGEQFTPVAQVTHPDHDRIGPVPLDHGVASETYHENRTRLVEDFRDADRVEPLQQESGGGISVPLGTDSVFQAVSRNPGDFDAFDLELAELLVSHAAASRERLDAEAELRSQRDRLGALFENIPDAAVSYELVDDDPYVRAVNSSFEAVFGYESEDVVGENLDDFILPPGGDADAEVLNLRLKRGENIRTECERRTDAGVRTFILQVVPIELGKENVAGFAIYTDITDRRERERELRQQNERLDEFANIVSHDLRNPLAIASGYLDLAEETGSPESFERVKEALTRMDRLVEDLLSLARKGQVVGETSAVDVSAVATQAWAGVETQDATLDVDDTLTADADESRLVDLFENLFRNAIEHAGPETGVRVTALDAEGSRAGFAVEDDGPGVPDAQRESVFATGETTGETGIGYGLTIVNRIVEAHGWSVSVTEGSLGGARFEVEY